MATDVHEIVQRVESSDEFAAFTGQNPQHYLVHVFAATEHAPELGYYGAEADMITVFKTAPVQAMPPEEVFKQSGALAALDIGAVRVGLRDVLTHAERHRSDAYPQHQTVRSICILQQHDRPVWNVTLVTNTMQMVNVRLSATTGELLSRSMQSIMSIAR